MKRRVVCFLLAFFVGLMPTMSVYATTISDAKQQKQQTEEKLSDVNEDIENLEEGIEEAEAEIEEIDSQLVTLLMTVDILKGDIEEKEGEITQAEADYEAALAKEQAQHEAMKLRIKYMYEKGDETYMQMLIQAQSFADLLNKVEYTEKLYSYDREMLLEYQYTRQEVLEAKMTLEEEKAEIEEVEADLEEQSAELATLLEQKKRSVADFDSKLSKAKNQAKEYQAQIKEQTATIKKLEAEEAARKKAEEEARKKAELEAKKKQLAEAAKKQEASAASSSENIEVVNDTGSEGSGSGAESQPVVSTSEGSSKGQEIANYACQFVGNPYVSGGTSLTNGCDCSGFTQSVFAHFGISIPRSSYSQATWGQEVSVSDIQPGDVLYFGGHVAIYIGNGMIVHASTAATGIKYSSAAYRSIITARRFY